MSERRERAEEFKRLQKNLETAFDGLSPFDNLLGGDTRGAAERFMLAEFVMTRFVVESNIADDLLDSLSAIENAIVWLETAPVENRNGTTRLVLRYLRDAMEKADE